MRLGLSIQNIQSIQSQIIKLKIQAYYCDQSKEEILQKLEKITQQSGISWSFNSKHLPNKELSVNVLFLQQIDFKRKLNLLIQLKGKSEKKKIFLSPKEKSSQILRIKQVNEKKQQDKTILKVMKLFQKKQVMLECC
ncbi:unnamed protein product [Paramecium pentaurelia]|uniref:Uncharacterized protein n=1 Tax=Paramecium pentaurelia TaxID=43138 RepID=A0A8S1Y7Y0_9CILI|nr:unnamed protein product [Paramecium pentaurelia]